MKAAAFLAPLRWLWRRRPRRAPGLDLRCAWLREPPALAGRRVCILASFSADGSVARHTLHLARAWRAQGWVVVLAVATGDLDAARAAIASKAVDAVDGLAVRANSGYDFGTWAAVLRLRPDTRDATLLALTNDSVYGPMEGFAAMIARAESADADVIAATGSVEFRPHVQSYLVFYKPRALRSAAFERFWNGVGGWDRHETIRRAELPLRSRMERGGLAVATLFLDPEPGVNPTLVHWRELIDAGFPFLKAQLLRDTAHGLDMRGWEGVVRGRGYDPAIALEHLARTR